MKKKNNVKSRKLAIKTETVRKLGDAQLDDVAGGYLQQTKTLDTAVCGDCFLLV